MKLDWLPEARSELRQILDYISDYNPEAAARLNERIEQATERLTLMPYLHRVGRVGGTREVVVTPNYILIYRISGDTVFILSVLHTRQQYP